MKGSLPRIALIVMIAVAVFLYVQFRSEITKNEGRLVVQRDGDAVVLYWHDAVEVPMALRIEEAILKWKSSTNKFTLDLSSPGGALREGNRVIELIKDLKKTHQFDTRVGPQGYCLSMCVPIYLQGQNRIAGKTSRWMFHEPRFVNFISGEDSDRGLETENQYFSDQFFEKYFVNSPISPKWRNALQRAWVGREIWRDGTQLVEEGSNIITELK